ncbi:hypothetical protein [Salmonirosea aquatica]|uniref:Uncharacterized protein n=1 Tax=Salmonirosea aquatica TaxID=2654236 RepID=A0A7C9BCX0_9BACT|nr:hypothetical protein [Cytophagaceae bacterium SJW1-29]
MKEELNYSEEVKRELLSEIASMKRQSVFSLIFAIMCVVGMVYLFYRLRASNRKLTEAKEKLAQQNVVLEEQKASLTTFKNELDAWRMSLLEVDSIPASVAEPEAASASGDFVQTVDSVPVIERPTTRIRRFQNRSRLQNGTENASLEDPGEVPSPASEIALDRPTVVYEAKAQQYSLKKQEAISATPFFGYIIYIQDATRRQASDELLKILKEKGAIVPAIQSKNLPPRFPTSIKYFHPQDEKNAEAVRNLLLTVLVKDKEGQTKLEIPVTYISNAKVSLGQLEVWIGEK